jgi:hypothetical protein
MLTRKHTWSSHLGTTLTHSSGKCHANVRWHLEFTPWLNAYIQVLETVMLMLEHIWSSHFGTTLKYKVLLSFLHNITIVYSNKGRGMDTLA